MDPSWTEEHPKSVASVGSVLLAVVAAAVAATVIGAVAVQGRSFGPLVVIASVTAFVVLIASVPPVEVVRHEVCRRPDPGSDPSLLRPARLER